MKVDNGDSGGGRPQQKGMRGFGRSGEGKVNTKEDI